jgi:hypothetical protein
MNPQETKSPKELKSLEAKEEYIMKYVLVLQRKWEEEEESNNEPTSNT